MFSYGSGLASAMYSLRVAAGSAALDALCANMADLHRRLDDRKTVPPAEFERVMKLREETHHLAPYTPVGSTEDLFPGTYYITNVDDKHRRTYVRTPLVSKSAPPVIHHSPLRQAASQTVNGTT